MYQETEEIKYQVNVNTNREGIAKKEPVSRYYSELQEQLTKLESQIQQLSHRLTPVCRPDHPVECGKPDSMEREILGPLANALLDESIRVKALQSTIVDLLGRLEV